MFVHQVFLDGAIMFRTGNQCKYSETHPCTDFDPVSLMKHVTGVSEGVGPVSIQFGIRFNSSWVGVLKK